MSVAVVLERFTGRKDFSFQNYGNGHIHDTYKVSLPNGKPVYILQKLNQSVFKNLSAILSNYLHLSPHFSPSEDQYRIPKLYPDSYGMYFLKDSDGFTWRLMEFIPETYSLNLPENETQTFQAGAAYGWFIRKLITADSSDFQEVIPDFHRLSFRMKQLSDAVKSDPVDRLKEVLELLDFYQQKAVELIEIEKMADCGIIPMRLVHNDTKLNNLLFRNERVCAVIDLDTVGPGIVLNDFGDAVRTLCNTAAEDEKDLGKVKFNSAYYEQFKRGFLSETESHLTAMEIESLTKAPILMTTIMGIRFLTDYINGDTYYKTKYPEHNLVRSKVQRRFIEESCKVVRL